MAAQTGLQAPGSTSSHMQGLKGALYSWTVDSPHLYGAAVGVGPPLVTYGYLLGRGSVSGRLCLPLFVARNSSCSNLMSLHSVI